MVNLADRVASGSIAIAVLTRRPLTDDQRYALVWLLVELRAATPPIPPR